MRRSEDGVNKAWKVGSAGAKIDLKQGISGVSAVGSKRGQGGEAYTRSSRLSSGNIPPVGGGETRKDAINNYKV